MSLFDKLTGRVSGFIDDVLLPDEQRALMVKARKALDAGEPGDALALLESVDAERHNVPKLPAMKGEALMALGRWQAAAEALRAAISQRATAALYQRLGQALARGGDLRGARDALREGLRQDPLPSMRFDFHRALGDLHRQMKRPDRAIRDLRKALRPFEKTPPSAELAERVRHARIELAQALMERGDLGEARALLDMVAAEAPLETPEALRAEGSLLLAEGDAARALLRLDALLSQHPNDLTARMEAARAASMVGSREDAREHLQKALDLAQDARRPEVLGLLGLVELAAQQHSAALEHLSRTLEVQPDHTESLGAAGWAALGLAQQQPQDGQDDRRALLESAERFFERQRVLIPDDAEPLHGLGQARLIQSDWTRARRLLEEACEAGAGLKARVGLARACMATQDPATAVATLRPWMRGRGDDPVELEAAALLQEAYERLNPALPWPPEEGRSLAPLTEAALALRAHAVTSEALLPFVPRIQRLLQALDEPLDIAVLGEFNAGKSTLVNALMGETLVPTGVLPTTAHINVLRFGPRRAAQLHLDNGAVEEVALTQLKKRIKKDKGPVRIDHIEVLVPHPDLRRVHFWDTPGFNALDPDHERHARQALLRAEAIIWLLDAGQALADSEMQLLDTVHHGDERLLVVLNKIDRLGSGDERQQGVQTLVTRIDEHLAGRVSAIFAISALEGFKARQAQDAEALTASGLQSLLDHLQGDVYERVASLKALEGTRAWEALLEEMREATRARQALISELQTQLDAVRTGLQGEIKNFTGGLVDGERRRLQLAMDSALTAVAREIHDAVQPAPGLVDALLTRNTLAQEDLDFVRHMLLERFEALLQRSARHVSRAALEAEGRLTQGVEGIIDKLEGSAANALRRRVGGYLTEARALRALLTDRVYGRYRAFAQGRASAPGVTEELARVAREDTTTEAAKGALRQMLPDVEDDMMDSLRRWAEEYFAAAARFCDVVGGDLQILAIESQALTEGLQAPTKQMDDAQ